MGMLYINLLREASRHFPLLCLCAWDDGHIAIMITSEHSINVSTMYVQHTHSTANIGLA